MAIADEIRARVKQADEARIETRAERAATVALAHSQRAELLAQLAVVEADLQSSVRSAIEVMTLDELIEFSGVPRADIRGKVPPAATSVKARSTKTRRRPAGQGAPPRGFEHQPPRRHNESS